MYTIEFTSNGNKFTNLSLGELMVEISDHFGYVGRDFDPIYITNSETGVLYEIIYNEEPTTNYKFYSERLNNYYTILELVELMPYL